MVHVHRLGDTHVICTASFDKDVLHGLKHGDSGWLTAEYGMTWLNINKKQKRSFKGNNLEEQLRSKELDWGAVTKNRC